MARARVLISDKLSPEGLAVFDNEPEIQADHTPGLSPDELLSVIGDYDGLVIRSGTQVTAEVVAAAKRLRVVGRAGIGVDNVDQTAANQRGIVIMNTPGGNTVTTAEHAVSMLLAMARNVPQATASMKAGKWEKSKFTGVELLDKTLGIIGVGNIGTIVADRAQGLRMKVIAYDPFLNEEAATRIGVELVSLDELYSRSHFISIHTPKTPETSGLVDAAAFARMKKGVRIVNCARGGIVDEDALADAIESGQVAGAALDVFDQEPPPADHRLLGLDAVICTPHLGASTDEAQVNVAVAVAQQVCDYLVRGEARNAINLPAVSAERLPVLRPFLALGEKIGSLQAQMSNEAPKEVRIEISGEPREEDMKAVSVAVLKGLLSPVMESVVNDVNAPFLARDRGIRVIESKTNTPEDFINSITVRVLRAKGTTTVSGAVFGENVIRIVRINRVYMEAVPEGRILLLHNRDVPGVVGSIGTILGKHGVNIAGIELGRDEDGMAVSLVHIDGEPPPEVLTEIRRLPPITGALLVRL